MFSEGGASEAPAAQILALGTVLLKPQMNRSKYQQSVQMGVCWALGQGQTADSH